MGRDFEIRQAVREDGPAVAAMLAGLRGTAFDEFALSREKIAAYAGRYECWATVLFCDRVLAGVVLGMRRRAVLLFIDPAHRGKGFGSRLLAGCPATYFSIPLRDETVPVLNWLKRFTRSKSVGDRVVMTLTTPRKQWTTMPNPFAGLEPISTSRGMTPPGSGVRQPGTPAGP